MEIKELNKNMVQMIREGQYLKLFPERNEEPDYFAVRMMEENSIVGLMDFRVVQNMRESYFRYKLNGEIMLREWLENTHMKSEVISLLNSLIFSYEEVEAYLLEQECLYLDMEYISVKQNQCNLVYIPIENVQTGDMLNFIKNLISEVKYARDEDFTYIYDLMNAFSRNDITSIEDLKKWLKALQETAEDVTEKNVKVEQKINNEEEFDKNDNEFLKKGNEKKVTENAGEKALKAANKSVKEENSGNIFESFFDNSSKEVVKKDEKKEKNNKKSLFGKDKKKDNKNTNNGFIFKKKESIDKKEIEQVQKKENNEKNVIKDIINEIDSADRTMLVKQQSRACLIQWRNHEEYSIENRNYTIGSDKNAAIVIRDNATISRKHASIFKEGNDYFIRDEGSTNGTRIDGTKLTANQAILLKNRARIQLSDENFTFEIRS